MNTYTPSSTKIIHHTYTDLSNRQIGRPVHIVQYDDGIPILAVKLYNDGQEYIIPTSAHANIRLEKADGNFIYNPALGVDSDKSTIYFEVTKQMAALPGELNAIVELEFSEGRAATGSVQLIVDQNPIKRSSIESSSENLTIKQYVEQAKNAASASDASKKAAKTSETNALNYAIQAKMVADEYAGLLSDVQRRNVYRGKSLGSSVSSEQKTAIQNGTFDAMFIGDYWTIEGVNWRIADMDYWYGCGDKAFTRHHLVIVPDTTLYSAKMNDTNITTGGYAGSKMYTTNLEQAKTKVRSAFGSMLLTHREYLVSAVKDGRPSDRTWFDSDVELMTETMIYGGYIQAAMNNGTGIIANKNTINKQQLSLFRLNPRMANIRTACWLRDVVSASNFASTHHFGYANFTLASISFGVRPVFPIG